MGKRIDRIGEEIANNQGIKMKIISYRNVHDIDIQFEDNYIKQVADEYKNDIPKKLYKAMYNYEVEITD